MRKWHISYIIRTPDNGIGFVGDMYHTAVSWQPLDQNILENIKEHIAKAHFVSSERVSIITPTELSPHSDMLKMGEKND